MLQCVIISTQYVGTKRSAAASIKVCTIMQYCWLEIMAQQCIIVCMDKTHLVQSARHAAAFH